MAFQRTFKYRGATAAYLAFRGFEQFDVVQRTCMAIFSLYVDKATRDSDPKEMLVERAVRLRLDGDKFDKWLGKAALKGGGDVIAQAYKAARAEPVDYWGGTLPNLADAVDV